MLGNLVSCGNRRFYVNADNIDCLLVEQTTDTEIVNSKCYTREGCGKVCTQNLAEVVTNSAGGKQSRIDFEMHTIPNALLALGQTLAEGAAKYDNPNSEPT